MKPHREFDLYFETTNNGETWPYGCTIEERREKWTPGCGWAEPNLHVIEYDAYLEALAQAEKLAAALSESKTMLSKIKNHPFCLRCDSNMETKHRANAITSKALAEFHKWKDEK